MKKIIALAIVAVTLVSASFALDFEIGAKVIGGQNVAAGSSAKDTVMNIKPDSNFEFGGSVYANFALLGGLGLQFEPTLIKSNVTFNTSLATVGSKDVLKDKVEYDVMTFDVPLMLWLNLDLWKLTIGGGVGVDFSTELNRDAKLVDAYKYVSDTAKNAAKDLKSVSFAFITGVDAKLYLTKHLGVVASARYIMDITKKEVPLTIDVGGYSVETGTTYPAVEYARRFLYGGVGMEFKLF
ncbi:MAG: hypothetical protein MJ188_00510 [Treponema sp.]|nr:hypothetical protein [Treponema sp.]